MTKYKKKPIVVDAVPFKEGLEDHIKYFIPMFGLFTEKECHDAGFTPSYEEDKIYFIQTLEGEYPVQEGKHMIVTGVRGERYPVEMEIFYETYEKVEIL